MEVVGEKGEEGVVPVRMRFSIGVAVVAALQVGFGVVADVLRLGIRDGLVLAQSGCRVPESDPPWEYLELGEALKFSQREPRVSHSDERRAFGSCMSRHRLH